VKIQQLSLFLENKPGHILEPCRLLAREGINIRTLSLADTREFGILRLIVSDWERAAALLGAGGYAVRLTEVLAVEVADQPGGLAGILEACAAAGISIEYMYAFTFGRAGRAVLILRFDRPDDAIAALTGAGFNLLDSVEVYQGLSGRSGEQ
jgi:hypothetical protein